MKTIKLVFAIISLLLTAYLPAYSDNGAAVNIDPLPNTGTYYIIPMGTNDALQPNAATLGQNVFLTEFNRSGMQQWKINRKIDPVTNQPTNRYSIRLAGENEELNFQPHPSVGSAIPIVGLDKVTYELQATQGGVFVKCVERNGDAMYYNRTATFTEPHFGPNDGSPKFIWNFLNINGAGGGVAVAPIDPLPQTGTYFIINNSSHEALQPNAAMVGQNVFLVEFNKGGTQKWAIDRKIDPVTNQPTNRYTIRLAGEIDGLNFEPHPSVGDACPVLGMNKAVFTLEPSVDGLVIKSVDRNGDAMFVFKSGMSEPHFAANDGSPKFRWNFVRTE
jgi:hypothetical protein